MTIYTKKETKLNELEQKVDHLRRDMELLEKKASLRGEEAKAVYRQIKQDFDYKIARLKFHIQEKKNKTEGKFEDLKEGLHSAFEDLKDAYYNAKQKF